ncbi:phosphate acyltransferase PlsX [Peptacetobacter hiranonis]|uniref:phosphate acyltransferase PlsX n=1 Tax=Peptacetobacter hiranonis TaxID=89152 RepID=UPI002E76B27B|nr:phosphate acyltransferase PlsX [Peptacetobacter hiranonis]MEE0248623.1 phosphate acyltransferase PlsX [Peptacetobacter hiranonis]
MRIALDGMGGDNAPVSNVKGAVDAINEYKNVELIVTGDKEILEKEFAKYEFDKNRLEIIHTTEVVENEDKPVKAIRSKKDSSMVVALRMVKEGKAEAVVSAGNTGALLAGGLFVVGRIKGIDRPCLCPAIPNVKKGMTIIADGGANADCKPRNLVEFAAMSDIYSKKVLGIEKPRVAVANVGAEEGKGNDLVKKTYEELKGLDLNFIGNVEARDVINDKTDIIVCDGFTGNILLKSAEGIALSLMGLIKETLMSSTKGKLGALLIKDDLRKLKAYMDYSEYGGAPLLGVKGGVIKAHGSSDAKAIKNAVRQAIKFAEGNVVEDIKEFINEYSKKEEEASGDEE